MRAFAGVCLAALVACGGLVHGETDDAAGNSPLMLAVLRGSAAEVQQRIVDGADVRHRNKAGVTALHWALDDVAKAKALVAAGADPNAADATGATPMQLAAGRDDNLAVVELLLAHGGDAKRVGERIGGSGDPKAVRLLLDHGADARAPSALHLAAIRGYADNVRMLLDAGAPIDAQGGQGLTPLMWAAQMGRDDVVKILLERHANPNIVETFNGSTALMQAAASDRAGASIVQALVDAGADTAPVDDEGATALTWAIRRGDPDIIQIIAPHVTRMHPPRLWAAVGTRVSDISANTIPTALARGAKLLEQARPRFRALSGCPSCHHDALPAMAIERVARLGMPVDQAARTAEATATARSFTRLHERHLEGTGFADILEAPYLLVGMAAASYPPDTITEGMTRFLALRQAADGGWHTWMQRIPEDGSDIAMTALSIRALAIYAASSPGTAGRIARARAYLDARTPSITTTEDRVFQILGLRWAGATAPDVAARVADLASKQRDDGGWGQRDAMRSDAYATGQTIVALCEAGAIPVDDPRLVRAGTYLLDRQYSDGSWFVATRALRFQPWIESGFPQGRSQYMSASATSWAVMALACLADSRHH